MGKVGSEYNWQNTGRLVFFDESTYETLRTTYPLEFKEDFLGTAVEPFDGTIVWSKLDAGAATEAIDNDSSNGTFSLTLTSASGAEDAGLYCGDNKNFDLGNGLIFEARVNMAVSPGTGVAAVFGMAGDTNADKDSITESAWFRFQASLVGLVETNDTTNNEDDIATGLTPTAGDFHIYRIDFTTLANVKFFVDGVRVASSQTFDMSNLSSGEQQMQPYFSMDKASGSALGTMTIDYVKIFSERS